MEIVDAHHHLWDLERNTYPWLAETDHDRGWGDWSALRHSYLAPDLLADAEAAGLTLLKSVHVQANFDPTDPVGETRWLEEAASAPGARGLPTAIVGFCDLSAPNAEAVLTAHAAHRRVRGIRQVLNRHPDPKLNRAPRDLLGDPAWHAGLERLAAHGLSFDAQIYHHQAEALSELAATHGGTAFILDHMLMPAERDPENLAGWRRAVRLLAKRSNAVMKISGFGMVDNDWTVEALRPFVRDCLDAFGPERTMFASNFPVDKLMASYGRVWDAYSEIVADLSEAERRALFRGTAERIYRI